MSTKKKVIIGVVVGLVIIGIIVSSAGDGGEPPPPTTALESVQQPVATFVPEPTTPPPPSPTTALESVQQPVATFVPEPTTPPPPSITAEKLYAEREANATRFDHFYKGQWVTVTGLVGEIDGGQVRLVTDMESYRLLDLMFNYIALEDLSKEVQISVDKGQSITATCKVGNYILGTMFLEDCEGVKE